MADRLKWLLGLAAAALFLIVWVMLAADTPPSSRERTALQVALNRVHSEQNRAQLLLLRRLRVDSLLPLLPAAPALATGFVSSLRPDVADQLRSTIASELASADSLRARIGVFIVPAGFGAEADRTEALTRGRIEYYANADAAAPYCMVVGQTSRESPGDTITPFDARIRVSENGGEARLVREDILGPCLWWAKYGKPGTGVGAWLERGGRRLALNNPAVVPVPDSLRPWRAWGYNDNLLVAACQMGEVHACRDAVASIQYPEAATTPSGVFLAGTRLPYYGNYGDQALSSLLAEVEREFGRERFARFWQSDADVEPAFQAAFGEPLGSWVRDWVRHVYGVVPRGARMDWHHHALVVLTVLLLLLLAMHRHRQQQA